MSKTIFILGAGASMPYHFPSGEGLVKTILENLDIKSFDNGKPNFKTLHPLARVLLKRYDYEFLKSFRDALLNSNTTSIDSFLTIREDYREIGKMCITYVIAQHEYSSYYFNYLFVNDWYKLFWNKINLCKDSKNFKFAFFTFNYDRSLEFYIANAYKNLYNVNDDYIKKYFDDGFHVYHLHGSLGNLKFQGSDNYFEYGDYKILDDPETLLKVSSNIDIIYEAKENDNFKKLHKALSDGDNLYFLGFGFNEENLGRINLKKHGVPKTRTIHATTFGLTNMQIIEAFTEHIGGISYSGSIESITSFNFSNSKVVTNKGYDCYKHLSEYLSFNSLKK